MCVCDQIDFPELNAFCDEWMCENSKNGKGSQPSFADKAGEDLVPEALQREVIIKASRNHATSMKVQSNALAALKSISPAKERPSNKRR